MPAVPGSPYLASLTPDSAGLTLIQLVWLPTAPVGVKGSPGLVCACSTKVPLFSRSDPLFSRPDPLFSRPDPYSAGLALIQPVWPLFSWSDPLFSRSDPLIKLVWPLSKLVWPLFSRSDPYSAGLTPIQPVWPQFSYSDGLAPIQLVWWVPTAPVGAEGSLGTFCACSIWVPLFSALRERETGF